MNKIDDDVYKVLQLTRLYQPANITKQAFEFLVQLETYIKAIAPPDGGGIDIKREAMRLVTLGFYKSKHDVPRANQIYKRMRHFDRKTRFRQSLVTWFANGMGEEYEGVREDLLKHGTELMHLVLRRREFPYDINCIKMRERIRFLIEQSTVDLVIEEHQKLSKNTKSIKNTIFALRKYDSIFCHFKPTVSLYYGYGKREA